MSKKARLAHSLSIVQDDSRLTANRRDMSMGANSRLDAQDINEHQAVKLQNVDITVPGKRVKRPGLTEIADTTLDKGTGLFAAMPDGGSNTLQGVFVSGTTPYIYDSSGSAFSIIAGTGNILDTGVTTAFQVFKTGGDGQVMMHGSATKNWYEIKQDGTVTDLTNNNDAPPRSNVGCYFNGRMWVLTGNKLYWSDAYPGTFVGDGAGAGAFTATDWYYMPCGTERFLIGIRNKGLIAGGKDEIRYVQPSNTPAATDSTGILVKDGCVANRSAAVVGDDIFYLAKDGVRGVFKTQYDTLQYKTSQPLSYALKDEFETINWAHIDLAAAVSFDNKYFLSLPVDSSTYNNAVWVYFPATNGWVTITGWTVSDWAVMQDSGEDKLYATDGTSGEVYRAWYGSDDDGTDIDMEEIHRKEDLGKPFEEKRGGEVIIRTKATGTYDVEVYGSFDEGGYTLLGTSSTLDHSVSFTAWTLPLIFQDAAIKMDKFHIDRYGPWYQAQLKIKHDGGGGSDLTVLQHSIVTFKDMYDSEED